jgi:hypothetical protein
MRLKKRTMQEVLSWSHLKGYIWKATKRGGYAFSSKGRVCAQAGADVSAD